MTEIFSHGELPWKDVIDSQVMLMHRQLAKLSCPQGCPSEMYALMQGCWKVDSGVRLSSADVRQQLAEMLGRMDVDTATLEWPSVLAKAHSSEEEGFAGLDLHSAETRAAFASYEIGREELQLGRQLGKGAFGVVHMATVHDDSVAVKTLTGGGAELQEKFLLEARLLCALRHASIVRLVHVCTASMPYAIAVELMDTDLKAYLRRVKDGPGVEELVGACVQVAQAMEHLAQHRVIHRDLAARFESIVVGLWMIDFPGTCWSRLQGCRV